MSNIFLVFKLCWQIEIFIVELQIQHAEIYFKHFICLCIYFYFKIVIETFTCLFVVWAITGNGKLSYWKQKHILGGISFSLTLKSKVGNEIWNSNLSHQVSLPKHWAISPDKGLEALKSHYKLCRAKKRQIKINTFFNKLTIVPFIIKSINICITKLLNC